MIDYDSFELLTFDCYGTLIDWENGILGVLQPLLVNHGMIIEDDDILATYAKIESAIESGPYKPYASVLRELLASLAEQFGFCPNPTELNCLVDSLPDWPTFGDTVGSLEKLKSKYKLGIISNIDDELFAASNRRLKVEFDYVITARQVEAYKPSLKLFERALEVVALPKQKILHVAQSLFHDHVPAQQFGLQTVWINRRVDRSGSGATPQATATPNAEFPDLASLVTAVGL
jgi:2-haloacid dehalogenase